MKKMFNSYYYRVSIEKPYMVTIKLKLQELLQARNTKTHWIKTANWVLENQAEDMLMELFYSENQRTSQRAAAVFMTLVDIQKNIFLPYQEQLVESLSEKISNTQKRNIVRLFQFIFIKEEVEGKLLSHCFQYLENLAEPIAVRAFSMTVAYRIGERYPQILPELKTLIESNLELSNSAGITNRGKKIVQKIEKYKA